MAEREYYFDNLKAVLIFCVVLGHFMQRIEDVQYITDLKRMIYCFHMPLFIFVTGYFSRYMYRQGRFKWEKIASMILLYVVFVVELQFVFVIAGEQAFEDIRFLVMASAPWYLFAVTAWYLLTLLFCRLKPAVGLLISLGAALIAGYFPIIGDFFVLSRILVFLPFFLLGFYMSGKQIKWLVTGKRRVLFGAAGAACAVCVVCFQSNVPKVFRMIYGNIPYAILGADEKWGFLVRLFLYAVAILISLGVMSVVPKKKMRLGILGERSLQIYVFHKLLRNVMQYTPFFKVIDWSKAGSFLLLLFFSAVVTIVFAHPVFETILKSMMQFGEQMFLAAKDKGRELIRIDTQEQV